MSRATVAGVEVSPEHQQNFYAGMKGEVAYGGVFHVVDEAPAIGAPMAVDITLPDGGRIRAQGSVRWVRTPELATVDCPAGCGIAWQTMELGIYGIILNIVAIGGCQANMPAAKVPPSASRPFTPSW